MAACAMESVGCPICGRAPYKHFAECEGFTIVECEGCGLLFVSGRRAQDVVATFYRDEYIEDDAMAEVQMVSYRISSLRREAARIRRVCRAGGRLLDVGAASGAFLSQFAGHTEWHAEGVEPSRVAVQYARNRFGVNVHEGYLRDQLFPSEHFDVITSLDTLMLHPQIREDIEEVRRILRPGGIFAVEIPGLSFRLLKNTGLIAQVVYKVPVKLNPANHLYYFNRRTLARLLEPYGFALIRSYPEQMPLYGSALGVLAKSSYYVVSGALYTLTRGYLNLAPKEFLMFRKVTK